jgi:hypothetical protein
MATSSALRTTAIGRSTNPGWSRNRCARQRTVTSSRGSNGSMSVSDQSSGTDA